MQRIAPRFDARSLAYTLAILLGWTLDISGALHVYGLSRLEGQQLAAATALLLVLVAAGWVHVAAKLGPHPLTPSPVATGEGESGARLAGWRELAAGGMRVGQGRYYTQRLLTLLMLLAWLATAYDFVAFLSPGLNALRALAFGGGALALLLALLWPPPSGWLLLGAALLGGGVRIASYAYVPIEPPRGDMLPLVQHALGSLLAGRSPYAIYRMPWELPLTYLPVTWLAYLPPYALGLDIRLTNLCAELAVGAVLVWLNVVRRPTATGWRGALATGDGNSGLLLWAWIFLEPTALHWSLTTTAPVLWALLSVLLALLAPHPLERRSSTTAKDAKDAKYRSFAIYTSPSRSLRLGFLNDVLAVSPIATGEREQRAGGMRARRDWWAALALGLCAAASPLAVVVAPFVLLHWLRSGGFQRAALLAAFAGLVAAIFVLPFLLWAPQPFAFGVWRWFNDNDLYPRLRWEMDNTWARMVGFSGIFWRRGLVGALKPLQALLLAGLAALYWRWGAPRARLAPLVAAAFLLFMVFNPVLWPYLYNPALVAALLAVAVLDGSA